MISSLMIPISLIISNLNPINASNLHSLKLALIITVSIALVLQVFNPLNFLILCFNSRFEGLNFHLRGLHLFDLKYFLVDVDTNVILWYYFMFYLGLIHFSFQLLLMNFSLRTGSYHLICWYLHLIIFILKFVIYLQSSNSDLVNRLIIRY